VKKVTTVIRRSPFNSMAVSDALRMSLGLTLTNNKVTVVFVEDGVYLSVFPAPDVIGYPDIKRHMETLKELGCELVVEKESMETRGLPDRGVALNVKNREEIGRIIEGSDRVIGF